MTSSSVLFIAQGVSFGDLRVLYAKSLIALLKDDKIWFVVLRRFSLCTRDCQGKIIDKLYCYLNKEFGVVN